MDAPTASVHPNCASRTGERIPSPTRGTDASRRLGLRSGNRAEPNQQGGPLRAGYKIPGFLRRAGKRERRDAEVAQEERGPQPLKHAEIRFEAAMGKERDTKRRSAKTGDGDDQPQATVEEDVVELLPEPSGGRGAATSRAQETSRVQEDMRRGSALLAQRDYKSVFKESPSEYEFAEPDHAQSKQRSTFDAHRGPGQRVASSAGGPPHAAPRDSSGGMFAPLLQASPAKFGDMPRFRPTLGRIGTWWVDRPFEVRVNGGVSQDIELNIPVPSNKHGTDKVKIPFNAISYIQVYETAPHLFIVIRAIRDMISVDSAASCGEQQFVPYYDFDSKEIEKNCIVLIFPWDMHPTVKRMIEELCSDQSIERTLGKSESLRDEDRARYTEPAPSAGPSNAGSKRAASPSEPDMVQILLYPPGQKGAVALTKKDFNLLKPCEMLNDNVIDFYLKYIEVEVLPRMDRERADRGERPLRFHFFNAFFYKRLSQGGGAQGNYEAVRKWTRKADIFSFDYLFIPVHESVHWALAIVCHPGRAFAKDGRQLDAADRACIMYLCSMGTPNQAAQTMIEGYLRKAWQDKDRFRASPVPNPLEAPPAPPGPAAPDVPAGPAPPASEAASDVPDAAPAGTADASASGPAASAPSATGRRPGPFFAKIKAEVPKQDNFTDCGVFVLEYIERFLQEPLVPTLRGKNGTLALRKEDWFTVEDIMRKRSAIQALIVKLVGAEETARLELEVTEPAKYVDDEFKSLHPDPSLIDVSADADASPEPSAPPSRPGAGAAGGEGAAAGSGDEGAGPAGRVTTENKAAQKFGHLSKKRKKEEQVNGRAERAARRSAAGESRGAAGADDSTVNLSSDGESGEGAKGGRFATAPLSKRMAGEEKEEGEEEEEEEIKLKGFETGSAGEASPEDDDDDVLETPTFSKAPARTAERGVRGEGAANVEREAGKGAAGAAPPPEGPHPPDDLRPDEASDGEEAPEAPPAAPAGAQLGADEKEDEVTEELVPALQESRISSAGPPSRRRPILFPANLRGRQSLKQQPPPIPDWLPSNPAAAKEDAGEEEGSEAEAGAEAGAGAGPEAGAGAGEESGEVPPSVDEEETAAQPSRRVRKKGRRRDEEGEEAAGRDAAELEAASGQAAAVESDEVVVAISPSASCDESAAGPSAAPHKAEAQSEMQPARGRRGAGAAKAAPPPAEAHAGKEEQAARAEGTGDSSGEAAASPRLPKGAHRLRKYRKSGSASQESGDAEAAAPPPPAAPPAAAGRAGGGGQAADDEDGSSSGSSRRAPQRGPAKRRQFPSPTTTGRTRAGRRHLAGRRWALQAAPPSRRLQEPGREAAPRAAPAARAPSDASRRGGKANGKGALGSSGGRQGAADPRQSTMDSHITRPAGAASRKRKCEGAEEAAKRVDDLSSGDEGPKASEYDEQNHFASRHPEQDRGGKPAEGQARPNRAAEHSEEAAKRGEPKAGGRGRQAAAQSVIDLDGDEGSALPAPPPNPKKPRQPR
eukprot:tig00001234_g7730.t1